MKKIIIHLLFVTIIILPINVFAASGSVNISCPSNSVKAGDSVDCTISVNSDGTVEDLSLPFSITPGAEVTKFIPADEFYGNDINNNQIDVSSNSGFTGSSTIGTLQIKINANAEPGSIVLSINNGIFHMVEGKITVPNASGTITVSNTSTTTSKGLKSLTCTGCKGQFTITEGNYEYLNELNSTELNTFSLSAVANNSSDTITFCELIDANTCNSINPNSITFRTNGGNKGMVIHINVGTGTNATTYNVAIIKPDILIAELSSLTVGGKSIALTSNIKEYEVTLDDVSNYQITATVKNSTDFVIENASDVLNTKLSGENTYSIYIIPRNNSSGYASASYKITVKKSGNSPQPSSSSSIKPSSVPSSAPSSNIPNNPRTGGTSAFVMGIILISSLFTSVYLYKRNMVEGNN